MAEISNTLIIGGFTVRASEAADGQIDTLRRYDSALGSVGHDRLHQFPASFYQISLSVFTIVNATNIDSLAMACPWPLTIWAADVGCETLAAGTAAIDILTEPAAGGGFASILDAAEAVEGSVGDSFRVAPEDGSEDLAYDDKIKINVAQGGGAGDLVGGQAHLYVQRR